MSLKQLEKEESELEDLKQENELLLLQLQQAQEELVEYFEQKNHYEKLYETIKNRWERLEKRLPDYVDFGAIELVEYDNVSDTPSLTWRIKDYAQSGVAIDELVFRTVLEEGYPGIGLVLQGETDRHFVPRLLDSSPEQFKNFQYFTASQFRQINAIVPIFEQLEASQWQGIQFPQNFDMSFWRPFLRTLMEQIKLLPNVLRFDQIHLKRELINPDYEHLWIELRGMSFGSQTWRKFEVRLGAALVEADGFSQYPKFEFPLIDGKTKPFESWYSESRDDIGAKVELRFALDKGVFDTAVFSKLSPPDRNLLLNLINGFPNALERLKDQRTAIHRPWAQWIDFSQGAVDILKKVIASNLATQTQAKAKKSGQLVDQKSSPNDKVASSLASVAKPQTQPIVQVETVKPNPPLPSNGLKVISVSNKVVASKPKVKLLSDSTRNKKTKKA